MNLKRNLLFILILIIAFWQIFFLQNGMKWDFVDAFLPSRYFFSESILNNQFPLWDPYLLYGIPIYADLVSVFNPEFWVVSNLFGYSNISLQFMYLVYVFIAGFSFNFFLKSFNVEKTLSFSLALAYMFSGVVIGNAQNLAVISGYAILPFVLTFYVQFLKDINFKSLVKVSLALFFMIFCSYPALTIILIYLLIFLFIYNIIIHLNDKKQIVKSIKFHVFLSLIVASFSSVLFVAYTQVSPFLSQYSGLNLSFAQQHPFSPNAFLSFLWPMSTVKDLEFFATDLSMSNGYFGIISFVLFFTSILVKPKDKTAYFFLGFGLFSLLASLGNYFILRGFLFDYFPLMNLFRYPSIFRVFTIFSFLTFIGLSLNSFSDIQFYRKKIIVTASVLLSLFIIVFLWSIQKVDSFIYIDSTFSFKEALLQSTFYDNIAFQSIIQFIVLMCFLLLLWKLKKPKVLNIGIILLFALDGIISTKLNIRYTVISEADPIQFYKHLSSSPKGFPIPELTPLENNSDKNIQNDFYWQNANVFQKKPTYDGLVSFKLDGFNHLVDHYPDLYHSILKEPIVYLSDDVRKNDSILNFNSKTLFVSKDDYSKLNNRLLKINSNDSLSILGFSPKQIEVEVFANNPCILTYQQNYYKGWQVEVDGLKTELFVSNFASMSVAVPQGKHQIVFTYSNPSIYWTFLFSYSILLILIGFCIYFLIQQNPNQKSKILIILISILISGIIISIVNRHFYQKNIEGLKTEIISKVNLWKDNYGTELQSIVSSKDAELIKTIKPDIHLFIDDYTNLDTLSQILQFSQTNYIAFAWNGNKIKPAILELLYSYYPSVLESKIESNTGLLLLAKTNKVNQSYDIFEDFESELTNGFKFEKERLIFDSLSGNHSYHYQAEHEWGTILEIPITKENINLKKILVLGDINYQDSLKYIPLVVSVDRDKTSVLWQAYDVNKFASKINRWSRFSFESKFTEILEEGDVLKIYFWNKEKAHFLIDNLKVKLIYSEE